MIPILFEQRDNDFTTNGIGRIADATNCLVTEELSGTGGAYEIEFDCPVDDKHYNDLRVGRQIAVAVSDGTIQPFRINSISRPISGVVTVHGYHRTYDTKRITVMPSHTAPRSPAELWSYVKTGGGGLGENPFTFTSEITDQKVFQIDKPVTLQQLIGGDDPSMIYIYGGELEFDQLAIKLLQRRGENRGVTVRYAKNMTDMVAVEESEPYAAIVPYANGNNGGVVTGYGAIVEALLVAGDYDVSIEGDTLVINSAGARIEGDTLVLESTAFGVVPVDVSEYLEGNPTSIQVTAAGIQWLNENKPWATIKELSVSFIHSSANTDPLRKVLLGDTVSVWHEDIGVTEELRVVKTVWDVIAERYESIDLGTPARLITKELERQMQKEAQDIEETRDIIKDVANGGFDGGTFIDGSNVKGATLQKGANGEKPTLDGTMDIHDADGEDLGAHVGTASDGVGLIWEGDPDNLGAGGTYLLENDEEARLRFGEKTLGLTENGAELDAGEFGKLEFDEDGAVLDAASNGSLTINQSGAMLASPGNGTIAITSGYIAAASGSSSLTVSDSGTGLVFGTQAALSMTSQGISLSFGSHSLTINNNGVYVDGVLINP